MRDTKVLDKFTEQSNRKHKEMELFKKLKQEVNHGAMELKNMLLKKVLTKVKSQNENIRKYFGVLTDKKFTCNCHDSSSGCLGLFWHY